MLAFLAAPIAGLFLLADTPPSAPPPSPPARVKCAKASHDYLYLGGTVTLSIANLDKLKAQLGVEPRQLVLYLNHLPINTLVPEYVDLAKGELRFRLTRTADSIGTWNILLKEPLSSSFRRKVHVSAGTPDGNPLPSDVESMGLAVIQTGIPLWSSIGLLIGSAGLFVWLARSSNILREHPDPTLPLGARPPYSLALTQMAFWFFLVLTTWLFLWIITQERVPLSPMILGLMGISAGTALGARLIETGNRQSQLDKLTAARAKVDSLTALTPRTPAQEEEFNLAKAQVESAEAALKPVASTHFLWDLLRDEGGGVSFHRFQIAVWTVALGVIFLVEVYRTLLLPDFDATLLALMGISSGTYVGFKLAP